jgi:copper transport protein
VRRLVVVVLLAGLWLVASGTAAPAHAVLRSSDPADGASLDRAPRQVTLTFTERPEPRLSTVQVLDADGRPVQAGKAAPVAGQPFQLQVPLGALPDGTYTVAWRTVSRDDGHVSGGSFAFGVGVAAPTGGPQGAAVPAATTPAPSPLATAGRWLLYCGLALLVGAAATGLAVYDRRLPPGARPLLWAGAGLAVVGLVARVAAERAAVGASLGDLVASDTGRNLAWLAAGVLASATAAGLLAARIRQPDGPDPAVMAGSSPAGPSGGVGQGWLAAVGLTAAAAMGLQVLAGHAAAPSSLRPLNLLAQWLHLLAAGVWAGGLVWLLAGLLNRPRQAPQSDTTTADGAVDRVQAVIRFSRLALPVVGVLAVTGLNRALDLAGGWSGLADTGFGRVLDLKLLLFAGLLVLAARNRYRLLPALAGPAGRLDALRRSVTAEIGLVVAMLLAAALLTQLPPGKFALATASARPSPPQASRSRAAMSPPRSASPSPPPRAPPAPTSSRPRSPTTTAASPSPPNASACASPCPTGPRSTAPPLSWPGRPTAAGRAGVASCRSTVAGRSPSWSRAPALRSPFPSSCAPGPPSPRSPCPEHPASPTCTPSPPPTAAASRPMWISAGRAPTPSTSPSSRKAAANNPSTGPTPP